LWWIFCQHRISLIPGNLRIFPQITFDAPLPPSHHNNPSTMASAIDALREACTSNTLSSASLSPDGQTLTISSTDHDATAPITVPMGKDKSVTYSLASIYLMFLHPSVLQYRKACESANVKDQVKILDKSAVSSYFMGETTQDSHEADEDYAEGAMKRKTQFAEEDRSKTEKRHRPGSSSAEKHKKKREEEKKKPSSSSSSKAAPITNEQLVANLSTIVDKRDKPQPRQGEEKEGDTTTQQQQQQVITPSTTPLPSSEPPENEKERELLLSWLSPDGFDVTSPTVSAAIEADREITRRITELEIPVGDSSSILRAGAGGEVVDNAGAKTSSSGGAVVKKRDFSRVLEIYQEVISSEDKKYSKQRTSLDGKHRSFSGAPPSGSKTVRLAGSAAAATTANNTTTKKIEGNPIIIVPNAMTSCITLVNVGFFLGKEATFVPRDIAVKRSDCGKRGVILQVTRKVVPRLGGGEITYDIIDNPTTRLKKDDWERVVAVIAQGASWQFKGWRYSDPVELFSRSFGFYVGYEGAAVPEELKGWNVKLGKVSRDRRGLDNICLASFWNG
jgi:parafibromin